MKKFGLFLLALLVCSFLVESIQGDKEADRKREEEERRIRCQCCRDTAVAFKKLSKKKNLPWGESQIAQTLVAAYSLEKDPFTRDTCIYVTKTFGHYFVVECFQKEKLPEEVCAGLGYCK
ncbi:hypothetical protein PPL_00424 [Heterostelium album PN500]|uniref:Saposin B-type domain-containing protein n=1 Tax=Heterostelium pallidum (strain ATCC 26659 / Pp 5 / PN500) TaxID=670386 RepID=D3AWF0_HETP5|nr:hypothetical protein PPL_00424 [Heterostelium album PN500]EFA86623.1 hypothetical protein PPL_00424 [Heterostelium album PN500]|eukprot:XP_020438728.1 hypothetical protein PPL_00424 [Heterostelium album PN500]